MSTKKDRLNEVYEHLRKHFGVHTKKDFADALKIKQPGLYSAMNGNEAYLTDNLFKRICAAYQGVFNLDYLLTGEGNLLTVEEDVSTGRIDKETSQSSSYMEKYIASLEKQIKDKDDQLEDKERTIKLMEQKIEMLEAMEHIDSVRNYPFPVGVADDRENPNLKI